MQSAVTGPRSVWPLRAPRLPARRPGRAVQAVRAEGVSELIIPKYCEYTHKTVRRPTRTVQVSFGGVAPTTGLGGLGNASGA